jgi:hypothetical protein
VYLSDDSSTNITIEFKNLIVNLDQKYYTKIHAKTFIHGKSKHILEMSTDKG